MSDAVVQFSSEACGDFQTVGGTVAPHRAQGRLITACTDCTASACLFPSKTPSLYLEEVFNRQEMGWS